MHAACLLDGFVILSTSTAKVIATVEHYFPRGGGVHLKLTSLLKDVLKDYWGEA